MAAMKVTARTRALWSFTDGAARAVACSLLLAWPGAVPAAQPHEMSGKDVVDAVCASCHATGVKGAPRIGDAKAWADRAKRGLTSLSDSAVRGIRDMPAHGGNKTLSDLEIKRAIAYMVNQSGGKWTEPAGRTAAPRDRTGEQVVKAQCGKCHQAGTGGAPRIGDREAWIPRLKGGLDATVRSAIKGHGSMPARGGLADLTDTELRAAILYMFNPAQAAPQKGAAAPRPAHDPNHATVDGLDVYLGIKSAEAMRTQFPRGSTERALHGGIPSGRGYYHVNISLVDAKSRAPVTDARVRASVRDPAAGTESKELELVTLSGTRSYGHYFHIRPGNVYSMAVEIQRPGSRPLEARFDLKP